MRKTLYTEAEIVNGLNEHPLWVEKGILAIYNRQTEDEKLSDKTILRNNVGFSGVEAKFGGYLAKWLLNGKHLSGKFLDRARKICIRHRKQLLAIANAKIQEVK